MPTPPSISGRSLTSSGSNWGYGESIAYFSSGYLPVRAEGLDRRLPTLGTGEYEGNGNWNNHIGIESRTLTSGTTTRPSRRSSAS